ncbi:hypothetical protein SCP_1700300 [Sparassis crispa]|uniref:BTB domain-containing protein n=1 Tax=Sparassis crispa TaxID=139825 RepID=A0A401H5I6_9APHY|nr:hypothetical protein SCP_1700300 [Sparassis crispa]GBE89706.1 hypothetical protein SCP_1700300 [Sparassis crispa]
MTNIFVTLSKMRLASQSQYFAKLFEQENAQGGSSSQGSEEVFTREIVDGCPVYEVLNLSVLDMERLLGALDDGLALSVVPPSFEVIVSILRAASTLSISSATAYAKHQLRKAWPSDLDKLNCGETDPKRVTELITIAKHYNVPEVLKRAFYELLRSKQFWLHMKNDRNDVHPGDKDFIRLLVARDEMQSAWIRTMKSPPFSHNLQLQHSDDADIVKRCQTAWENNQQQWIEVVVQSDIFEEGRFDPFTGLDAIVDVDWAAIGYCSRCVGARKKTLTGLKATWWKNLDPWLKLEGRRLVWTLEV